MILGLLIWFALFQPWGGFSDPDAFYHSTMAEIMLNQGLIREFPWLDLTTYNHPFVNPYVLFHAMLIPFVAAFGTLWGGQFAAYTFAILSSLVLYWCLKQLQVRSPYLWTIIAVSVPVFAARLSYGKASPVAIALYLVGCTAFLLGRHWLSFFVGLFYVWIHAGWPLLILSQGAMLFGLWLYRFAVEGKTIRLSMKESDIQNAMRVLLSTVIGCALGFVLHPYRSGMLYFLKIQILNIGIATPENQVHMGVEWQGLEVTYLYAWFLIYFLSFGVFVYSLLKNGVQRDEKAMPRILALMFPFALLLAMSFKSARYTEYLVPFMTLLFAQAASLVDTSGWMKEFFLQRHSLRGIALFFLVCAGLVGPRYEFIQLIQTTERRFDDFRPAIQKLKTLTTPMERIYHQNWGDMPALFADTRDLCYINGLDPTFLLKQNPDLSKTYNELMMGNATSEAYSFLKDQLHVRYAFISLRNGTKLNDYLKTDKRFEQVYADEKAIIYQVK